MQASSALVSWVGIIWVVAAEIFSIAPFHALPSQRAARNNKSTMVSAGYARVRSIVLPDRQPAFVPLSPPPEST